MYHDCGCHDIDLVCWVLGEYPESVTVEAHDELPISKEMNDVDNVMIIMKFPSNILASISLSRNSNYGYDQRIEVWALWRIDHSVHTPSQWETTLRCNVVSYWLGAYTQWSLLTSCLRYTFRNVASLCGGSIGYRWIPLHKKTSYPGSVERANIDAELWYFLSC